MPVVLDASVALAWCFPDESNEYADRVLGNLEGEDIWVAAIWPLEVSNAILVGERRKRIRQPEIVRFLALLEALPVRLQNRLLPETMAGSFQLAREFGLSVYDAAYLELALSARIPLATLDEDLRRAARKSGVTLYCMK